MEEANNATSTGEDRYERLQHQDRNNNKKDEEGHLNPTGPENNISSAPGNKPLPAHQPHFYEL